MKVYRYKDKYPTISQSAYLQDGVKIVGDVEIEDRVSIWFNSTLRGDVCKIILKEGCNVQELTTIHGDPKQDVSIGKYTTVGHNCIVHGCTIGDNVLIGMGSTLLNGSIIPDNCLVGAGSLVTSNSVFEEGTLILGRPAKAIRKLNEEDFKYIEENAAHYASLAQEYKKGFGEANDD